MTGRSIFALLVMSVLGTSVGCTSLTPETRIWRITGTEGSDVYYTQSFDAHCRGSAGGFLQFDGTVTFTPDQGHSGAMAHVGSDDAWKEPFTVPGTVSKYQGDVHGMSMILGDPNGGVQVQQRTPVYGKGYDFATFGDIPSHKQQKLIKFSADEVRAGDVPGLIKQ